MQKALFIVQTWCREVGMSSNADKTSMVLFTNNSKLVGFKKPILFGTELQLKNQVKYLGVILDEKLNWISHLDDRMQKATIAFWQCRRAIGKTWGLKPKVVYWINTSVVKPILIYAALLWWKKASQISVNRKTAHLQHLACISITGSMHSTPTAAHTDVPTLWLYIEGEARQATYRLNCSGEFTRARFGLPEVFEKQTKEWPSLLAPGTKLFLLLFLEEGFSLNFRQEAPG
jgi:hypothetical protein